MRHGFTLMETVIAIGVVAVLLTGFMVVFGPAADGIRKAISTQEADRLVSTLELELVNTRIGVTPDDAAFTGFDRALRRIKESTGPTGGASDTGDPDNALFVYQYRGDTSVLRPDGSPTPVTALGDDRAGRDYVLVPMVRRSIDSNSTSGQSLLVEDLKAIEGSLFVVKCVQLIYNANNELVPLDDSQRGKIFDPSPGSPAGEIAGNTMYPEAVLAFRAEFYRSPSKAKAFITGEPFKDFYGRAVNPVFSRNIAVRR